ncbi:hypothetical protein [Moraxella sp. VT-16-12]|uniref:hypothetical protein n=1 Tax=Moraxella sp. VT-16-12 TaxID=2014877 RepID=UPI000B7DC720|nr:hypothetical protein [Moraxella sp. VT-16-12]TWV81316.1 hypothetical protein CEW93_008375 [Moraxella sp. VT-16-12]
MEKQELVDFLLTVDKQYVDELVDILTDFGNGRIALNSTVKDVLLREKSNTPMYHKSAIELLVDEFYKFAGNTIMNQFTDNNVSYSKIFNEIYTKYIVFRKVSLIIAERINFSNIFNLKKSLIEKTFKDLIEINDKKSLNEKENDLLLSCFDNNYLSLDFSKRFEKISNFQRKNYKNLEELLNIPFLGKLLSTIIEIEIMAFTDGASADRITLPFIFQIIWLKKKYQKYNKIEYSEVKDLLVNESQESVINIRYFTGDIDNNKMKEKLDKTNITALNQMFGNLPTAIIKHETMNNNYAVLNISLDKLTSAKDGHGLRGMVHGYNQDGHFGILENVRIFQPDNLTTMVNANLVMGFASTILAQKHLADISQKLDEIASLVNKVFKFQEDERNAKIISAYKDCHRIFTVIREGKNIPDSEKISLKNHYTIIAGIYEHLKVDLKVLSNEIISIKFDTFFNRNNTKDLEKIYEKFNKFKDYFQQNIMCLDTIYTINYLLEKLEKDQDNYYFDITKDFVLESRNYFNGLFENLENHIKLIKNNSKSITNFDSTDKANQVFFQSRTYEIKQFKEFLLEREKGLNQIGDVSMKVLIEDGKIKEAEFL